MNDATPLKDPLDLLDLPSTLSDEEREIQATVAKFLADRVRPHIGEWFENAHFARELAPELGKLGVLGMHLDGYGCAGLTAAIAAAGALLDYVKHTQRTTLPHISGLLVEQTGNFIGLDAATRRNLEIDQTLRGEESPTLYSLLNTTRTAMGARLLRHWLHHPLCDRAALAERHEAVSVLIGNGISENLRVQLRIIGDIERITARIALKSARPRDLSGLRESLCQLPSLQTELKLVSQPLLQQLAAGLAPPAETLDLLRKAIQLEPSAVLREGGVVADGYDAELDEL